MAQAWTFFPASSILVIRCSSLDFQLALLVYPFIFLCVVCGAIKTEVLNGDGGLVVLIIMQGTKVLLSLVLCLG